MMNSEYEEEPSDLFADTGVHEVIALKLESEAIGDIISM